MLFFFFFFFFQAEDGIRDLTVTGVQTCALPIWPGARRAGACAPRHGPRAGQCRETPHRAAARPRRSAQRRATDRRMADRRTRAAAADRARRDRKSTRLNSSHSQISYAVFCLKKKK